MRFFLPLLLLVLSIFALSFLLLSYISPLYKNGEEKIISNSADAVMYFKPTTLISDCSDASLSATIFLNTKSAYVSSAQIELQYNTNSIYNFLIKPSKNNIFQRYLLEENSINEVRKEYGRSSFVISSNEAFMGDRAVATISFNTYPQVASTSTQIKFLNKSTVIRENSRDSILKETIPLTIVCQKYE